MNTVQRWLHERSLHSNDSDARVRAIQKLSASGDSQAVSLLLAALEDPDTQVRLSAAAGLGELGDDRVVDPLIQFTLGEREISVREAALGALAKIDHKRAIGTLLRALDDSELNVRQAAGWALRKIGWQHLDAAQKARVAIIRSAWDEVTSFGSAAVEPLEAAFHNGTHHIQTEAAEALGAIGTPEAIQALVSMLGDFELDHHSREIVARSLRRFCADELTDPQQALICMALGAWSDVVLLGAGAVEALVSALPYPKLSHDAARALIRIGPAGVDSLVRVVKDREQPTLVREAAAIALAEIGDARAAGPLLVMLAEPDMVIRQAAVWALQRLGWQAANDGHKALVALANGDWDQVERMGAAAVEPLLSMATEALASQETVLTLERILKSVPQDISLSHLRTLASLPDHNSPIALTAPPPDPTNSEASDINYTTIAKLARAELFRRGLMR